MAIPFSPPPFDLAAPRVRKPGRRRGKSLLYRQIADALRARLQSGEEFAVGTRLPGNDVLAQQLNVNRLTLRRAISDLISEGWLVAHPSRGTFVAERAPGAVQGSEARGSGAAAAPAGDGAVDTALRTVMVVSRVFCPADPGTYHLEFLNTVRHELAEIECALLIPPTPPPESAADVLDAVLAGPMQADGLLLLGPFPADALQAAARSGHPAVLLDGEPGEAPIDAVVVDNRAVGRLAAEHLRACGYPRAAVVLSGLDQPAMHDRLEGFQAAWTADASAGAPARLVDAGLIRRETAHGATAGLLASEPGEIGIFCMNDDMASGALQAVAEAGRLDSAGVVGVDDVAFAPMLHPALTTVRIPREAMARLAVRCLGGWRLARRERMPPVCHTVTPSLVARASTRMAEARA